MLLLLSFFFNDTATTEIYTLSLHDALPIYHYELLGALRGQHKRLEPVLVTLTDASEVFPLFQHAGTEMLYMLEGVMVDRKSTRLNSSHPSISYAVFCLKKKKKIQTTQIPY